MPRKSTINPPVNQTAGGVTVLPAPRKIALHEIEAVRREQARLYRDARAGLIPTQDAARLTYMLVEIRKSFESVDIEQRIAALEGGGYVVIP